MTAGQFREVDLDLLADYVGGALDGTPDAAEVSRLIGEDEAWAEAHAAVVAGVGAIRSSLTAWATEPVPMPADVVARLSSALASAPPVDAGQRRGGSATGDAGLKSIPESPSGDDAPDGAEQPSTGGGSTPDELVGAPGGSGTPHHPRRPGRQLTAVPTQSGAPTRPGGRGPGRRRWARRLAGPVAVATAVAGFAGFAAFRLLGASDSGEQAATTYGSASDAAGEQAAVPSSAVPPTALDPLAERVGSSGTDYTPNTLPSAVSAAADRASAPDRAAPTSPAPLAAPAAPETLASPGTDAMPLDGGTGLDRLRDRDALARCLDMVTTEHADGPIKVNLVDYASYQGRAALVVLFTDRAGSRWIWVTGPDCGTSSAGADTVYQTRVG
ncbi:hypothetical protein [Plantactinospora sp. CA-290183]|uniref:hypothetical protein n=1 Tax=Plantactinospora sp. CA-290183 TaxID=3240006 RepID=UPI003D9315B1